jgi:hypothetical protein
VWNSEALAFPVLLVRQPKALAPFLAGNRTIRERLGRR